jgi:SAM-dependent methyltransferase
VDPEVYDLVYSGYAPEVEFYVGLARAAGGPVLEVGCGTGRLLIPALAAGTDADGLDREPAMLAALRRKAAARGLAPRLYAGDMRDFTSERRYRLITVPFRAFLHLMSTEDQLRGLRCLREHLEPGGALVLDLFYPSWDYIAEHDGRPHVSFEFPHPESGLPVAVEDTSRFDRVNQVVAVERRVLESDARGYAAETHRYAFALRWIFRFEMELLLRAAGFTRWSLSRGFDGAPFEKDTEPMVWTAWRD